MEGKKKCLGKCGNYKFGFPFKAVNTLLTSKSRLGKLILSCLGLLNVTSEKENFSLDFISKKGIDGKTDAQVRFRVEDKVFELSFKLVYSSSDKNTILFLKAEKTDYFAGKEFGTCFSEEIKDTLEAGTKEVFVSAVIECNADKALKLLTEPSEEEYIAMSGAKEFKGELTRVGSKAKISFEDKQIEAECEQIDTKGRIKFWTVKRLTIQNEQIDTQTIKSKLTPLDDSNCFYESTCIYDSQMTFTDAEKFKEEFREFLNVFRDYCINN